MVNPHTGEVALVIDGQRRTAKLTLGTLAALEAELGEGSLVDLVQRFEAGRYRSGDVLALLLAGLRGGGWDIDRAALLTADIAGGPMGAAQAAAELLVRAFTPPA